jgi:hypothetical protein
MPVLKDLLHEFFDGNSSTPALQWIQDWALYKISNGLPSKAFMGDI